MNESINSTTDMTDTVNFFWDCLGVRSGTGLVAIQALLGESKPQHLLERFQRAVETPCWSTAVMQGIVEDALEKIFNLLESKERTAVAMLLVESRQFNMVSTYDMAKEYLRGDEKTIMRFVEFLGQTVPDWFGEHLVKLAQQSADQVEFRGRVGYLLAYNGVNAVNANEKFVLLLNMIVGRYDRLRAHS